MDRLIARSPWRRRLRWGLVIAAVVAAAALVVTLSGAPAERAVDVADDRITIGRVVRGEFDDFIQVRGRFIPLRTTLSAATSCSSSPTPCCASR
jgi:hypothetical protein